MTKIDLKKSHDYWDKNLDPANLGKNKTDRNFNKELSLYRSTEQRYAEKIMYPIFGKLCCELGGGLGTHAIYLAAQGAQVVVTDFSLNRLNALQKEVEKLGFEKNIACVECFAEKLPFPDGLFDLVYTKSVLIHTNLEEALLEIKRVLKPGGKVVFLEPSVYNPFVLIYRKLFAPKEWKGIVRYFSKKEIKTMQVVFPNLKVKKFYFFGFFSFIWNFLFPNTCLFKISLAITNILDFILFPLKKLFPWFYVFSGTKE